MIQFETSDNKNRIYSSYALLTRFWPAVNCGLSQVLWKQSYQPTRRDNTALGGCGVSGNLCCNVGSDAAPPAVMLPRRHKPAFTTSLWLCSYETISTVLLHSNSLFLMTERIVRILLFFFSLCPSPRDTDLCGELAVKIREWTYRLEVWGLRSTR